MKSAGFSLIEVLVAIALVMGGVATLAQLFVTSANVNRLADVTTTTALLAEGKAEELLGQPDLSASPAGTLLDNVPGYFDYVDVNGVLHGDASPAPDGLYVRRWSTAPLPGTGAIVVQVTVSLASHLAAADARRNQERRPGETHLVGVKARGAG
jgi:prepilin-type N-terminal cleavage/methylation domain-containing protein